MLENKCRNPSRMMEKDIFLHRRLQNHLELIHLKYLAQKPGNPFLFTVVATGEAPITYSIAHLPTGLSIDVQTGIITGVINKKGTYVVNMKAKIILVLHKNN